MDEFVIEGGRPLRGTVAVNGSKNAALPILIATLLTDEPCVVENVPNSRDIRTTRRLLESLGKKVSVRGTTLTVTADGPLKTSAPYDLVKQMRASVLVSGPLLARFGGVRVPLPGGCAIGLRPVDIHLKAFEDLGAERIQSHGDVVLRAADLRPGKVRLRFPSVGATQNIMMAAAALPGKTVLLNAAREPEMEDLGDFLTGLGAKVKGAGSSRVEITGSTRLHGARHRVIPDRLEAGTFLLACAAAGGTLRVKDAIPGHLGALLAKMKAAGIKVRQERGALVVTAAKRLKAVSIVTAPHPGFPTDLQPQWMTLMCLAKGRSRISEKVFENRFLHAAELARMGARITVSGSDAVVEGVGRLAGAPVMASDIRAGAALLIAALAAEGRSVVSRVYHIDRGHERIEVKLRGAGARIRRVHR